ncbi:MAG TPA: hypothetical protein VFY28_03125 [Candidatus Paceibacterota bacterium]|nr:hypothetical protein [Candidatus Paceibacterota bacterium]
MTIRNLISGITLSALVAVLALTYGTTVRADEHGLGVSLDARADVELRKNADDDSATTTDDDGETDEDEDKGKTKVKANAGAKATTTDETETDVRGQGEAHRSAVATFVHSLLALADRDGGIGAEVRAVAQSQNDAASSTAEAMAKVEKRSALATLLIGTDWKSIGSLKKDIRRTESDIERLEALLDEATDAAVRAELETQIEALVDAQTELEAFVEEHESTFSLFGWFTKLFASASAGDTDDSEDDTASTTEA